ncbi:hypothetical protein HDV00_005940 [Rhizophlyctis rosea]|nr:hypothetical protein HDV00_005940 [Rhizophlyctis rosea]
MADTLVLPIIPTRNPKLLLPGTVLRLQIERGDTTQLLDHIWHRQHHKRNGNKETTVLVGCVPVISEEKETTPAEASPTPDSDNSLTAVTSPNLYQWGVSARIISLARSTSSDSRITGITYVLMVEGISRFRVDRIVKRTPYIEAAVTLHPDPEIHADDAELQALVLSLRAVGHELSHVLSQLQLPPTVISHLRKMLDSTPGGQVADLFASMIDLTYAEKLQILETTDLKTRIQRVAELVTRQIQVLKISQELQSTVENKIGKKQREFLLRQQLEAIKKELGESEEGGGDEIDDLEKRVSEAKLPEEAAKEAARELKRIKRMHPSLAEYQVVRSYLDWLLDLPWHTQTTDIMDVAHARKQLDEDHYGLHPVKNRILEYLAVRKLKNDLRGPILCFVGPPGVGKTSLGRSIANALGRKFYRISLGGVRDEAEIRGHRRTYIGAMPGVIVQGSKRVGVSNPVFLLDEIDKLAHDHRGDPASALLEVLDPEQNSTFFDHYLHVPYDLSKVLFIATANDSDTIPGPLLDRMLKRRPLFPFLLLLMQEVIRIPGYTFEEKLHIAKRHLVPKQILAHGLDPNHITFTDTALLKIATDYTREAGVRGLEREIAAVCRSLAVEVANAAEGGGGDGGVRRVVDVDRVREVLGVEKYDDEVAERTNVPGLAIGLAWTASGVGGLLFIEATMMRGRGKLVLTGKLGEVIKESAQIGLTWVRSNAEKLGLAGDVLDNVDVHIHFPAGAIPKDGPSAGIAIITSLVSLLTHQPMLPYTAMTGEVTLRGQVLPVGGVKEKVLAAHRAGIKRIILPVKNEKDLGDVPRRVLEEVEVVGVRNVWNVLGVVFGEGVLGGRGRGRGVGVSERVGMGGVVEVGMKARL